MHKNSNVWLLGTRVDSVINGAYAYLKQLLQVIVTVLIVFMTDSEREKTKAARKYFITKYICLDGLKRGYDITESA